MIKNKEKIIESLNNNFNSQSIYEVYCDTKDFYDIKKNPIFYIVLYSQDDRYDNDDIKEFYEDFENENFGLFRLMSISTFNKKELEDQNEKLIWKEGKFINAS